MCVPRAPLASLAPPRSCACPASPSPLPLFLLPQAPLASLAPPRSCASHELRLVQSRAVLVSVFFLFFFFFFLRKTSSTHVLDKLSARCCAPTRSSPLRKESRAVLMFLLLLLLLLLLLFVKRPRHTSWTNFRRGAAPRQGHLPCAKSRAPFWCLFITITMSANGTCSCSCRCVRRDICSGHKI